MVAIIGASVFFSSNCIIISHNMRFAIRRIDNGRAVQSFSEEIKNCFGNTAYFANIFRGYNFTNGWIYSIMVFGQCYKDNLCCYGDISFA